MDVHNHLSSDISANLIMANIAEELTNTIKQIDIDKTDRNKILENFLEINEIVERSKSQHKFESFKKKLEEILTILHEPIHKCWMEKILMKTENLINFMKHSEKEILHAEEGNQKLRSEDIIRQCFNEWNNTIAALSKRDDLPPILSNLITLHLDHANSFLSESEVLIINYSRIRHEKSLELGSADIKSEEHKTNEDLKVAPKDIRDDRKDMGKEVQDETTQELKNIQTEPEKEEKRKKEARKHELRRQQRVESFKKEDNITSSENHKQVERSKANQDTVNDKLRIGHAVITTKYYKPVKLKNDDKDVNIVSVKEDLNDLNTELKQDLLNKLENTKLSEKRNRSQKVQKKSVGIRESDKKKSSQERNKDRSENEKNSNQLDKSFNFNHLQGAFEVLKKKIPDENWTQKQYKEIAKELENEILKRRSKRKRERKSNLSGHVPKTKDKQAPPPAMKLAVTQKFISRKQLNRLGGCRSSPTTETKDTDETRTSNKYSHATTATDRTNTILPMDNQDEVFKYLGRVSYKKLLSRQDCMSSKVGDTKSDAKGAVTNTDRERTSRERTGKSRASRRHTKHQSRGDKNLKSDVVDELRTRCLLIRKELESIESKTKSSKSRNKSDRPGGVQKADLPLSKEHVGYLCTIM